MSVFIRNKDAYVIYLAKEHATSVHTFIELHDISGDTLLSVLYYITIRDVARIFHLGGQIHYQGGTSLPVGDSRKTRWNPD